MAAASFGKVLQVLDLVENSDTGLTFDEIHAKIDAPRSTLYRYLKALTDVGLLVSLPNTGFTLGPRIAELDYKMRLHDPLIVVSRPVLAELVQSVTAVALLCRVYQDKVLCVHQEAHPNAMHSSYERGRARPLLRGAASRVILAHMPPRTIARLYEQHAEEFKTSNLGETLTEVKATLRRIRQTGWDLAEGQVTPGATGIAAPIFDSGNQIIGSLSLTIRGTKLDAEECSRIAGKVTFCAGIITNAVGRKVA